MRLIAFFLVCLFAGCVSLQVGGDFQSGRQALLRNQSEQALPYFLEAAKKDPDYVYRSMYFSEGIWTYVGRSEYALGKFQEARQSLERALARDKDDNMARLYLGLTLMRSGDYERGLHEVQAGMAGLHDWLEYINAARPFQAYWDPTREIRGAIEKDLEKIKAKDIAPQELIADGEWLGKQMEEEIDRARRDEQRRYQQDFDRRNGLSVGGSIGF
jgi:tetratricopeptide (TPR) repeat protein